MSNWSICCYDFKFRPKWIVNLIYSYNHCWLAAAAVSSPLVRVTLNTGDIGPVWAGHPTILVCRFEVAASTSFGLQYITWTKVTRQTVGVQQREFIYEYDSCSMTSQSYGSLAGRAQMTLFNQSIEGTQKTVLPLPVCSFHDVIVENQVSKYRLTIKLVRLLLVKYFAVNQRQVASSKNNKYIFFKCHRSEVCTISCTSKFEITDRQNLLLFKTTFHSKIGMFKAGSWCSEAVSKWGHQSRNFLIVPVNFIAKYWNVLRCLMTDLLVKVWFRPSKKSRDNCRFSKFKNCQNVSQNVA